MKSDKSKFPLLSKLFAVVFIACVYGIGYSQFRKGAYRDEERKRYIIVVYDAPYNRLFAKLYAPLLALNNEIVMFAGDEISLVRGYPFAPLLVHHSTQFEFKLARERS